jgi:hypothetical protein
MADHHRWMVADAQRTLAGSSLKSPQALAQRPAR